MAEKRSFGLGRASPWFARGMGVPGSRNSEPGGLVGATGRHIGIWKGPLTRQGRPVVWFFNSV